MDIERKRERERIWRENNKDKMRASRLKYYYKNKQESDFRTKLWVKNNKEYLKEYRAWYYYNVRAPRKNLQLMEKIKKAEKECWSVDRTNSIHHPWHTGKNQTSASLHRSIG